MRLEVPVKFYYHDKEYVGKLSQVMGAGSNSTFFLLIDDYYRGQLSYTHSGWVFHSQDGTFKEMAEEFGCMVIAWYDSHYLA